MSTQSYFSEQQVLCLLKPIHPNRVTQRNDNGMSHVEGYDIRAELNRVFGFGRWDAEVVDQVLLREAQVKMSTGGQGWNVVYRTRVRLTVKAPDGTPLSIQEATHVGENTHPSFGESHGNAVTNSETYALRRCAINFGDQFGLSLYNKGSLQATVRWTLVRPEAGDVDTDDVPEVNAEQDTGGSSPVAPPEDLSGWETRIGAATDTEALGVIRDDARRMRSDDELADDDAARVTGMIDARAAELDRAGRNPEPGAATDGEWVTRFKARIPGAGPDHIRPMKVEVMRAVSSKVIAPDAGTELLALLKERATAPEGATNDAAA